MESKKLGGAVFPLILVISLFILFLLIQKWYFPGITEEVFRVILFLNILISPIFTVIHENRHFNALKRKGHKGMIYYRSIIPNVKVLEPIPLKDFAEVALAPFNSDLKLAVVCTVFLVGIGPYTFPNLTVFLSLFLVFRLAGSALDIYWVWQIRAVPETWWAVDLGREAYICSTKEEGWVLLGKPFL